MGFSMYHKRIAGLTGLVIVAGTTWAQTAPPTKPHLIMWPLSYDVRGSIEPNPSSAIPIVRDDSNQARPVNSSNPLTPATFVPGADAADIAFQALVSDATVPVDETQAWSDKTRLVLFPRQIAADLFVYEMPDVYNGQAAPTNPDNDSRTKRPPSGDSAWNDWPFPTTFFAPKDRLTGLLDKDPEDNSGTPFFPSAEASDGPHSDTVRNSSGNITHIFQWYEPGQSNRSYRHPFLVNATGASPLRAYMQGYAARLKNRFDTDAGPLHNDVADEVQPTFIFDAEQAHVVQRPDKHSCIYMLWFLTQAKVPGTTDQYIWDTFKVPGSDGWTPPTMSEIAPAIDQASWSNPRDGVS